MADLPFTLAESLALRLGAALDVERKLPRALEALGPLAGRDVVLLAEPGGIHRERLAELGVSAAEVPATEPLCLELPDGSQDALVGLWSAFRGVRAEELAEADRVLRPGGRLLVVHDYGRDDVSGLRPVDAPEYVSWSRRDGPFLRGGFRLRVLHCFWTFATLEEARGFLEDAFGPAGTTVGAGLRRPRLSWNVAVYHRTRGGGEG